LWVASAELNGARSMSSAPSLPRAMLSVSDGVAIVVGIVIGSAIFETPSLVAANTGRPAVLIAVWVLGAAISVLGALCYAELAATYPDAGGDYHFLDRAWGSNVAFRRSRICSR